MTGIICINKPKGMSSFGVVSKVRGITREKKAGHTGTLDPMATGVLPIMLGGATRLLPYITDSDKGYRATFRLGLTTDSLDITGNVLTTSEVAVTGKEIEALLPKFTGDIEQIPPMYSAVSVDGVRLYQLARQGIEVERKSRKVQVKKIELVNSDEENHEYVIDVLCSKGTYIRTLIDDIGASMGCGGVMTELCRTSAMGFDLSRCIDLDELQGIKDGSNDFGDVLIGVDEILYDYPCVNVSQAQSVRFKNGGDLDLTRLRRNITDGVYRVYSPEGAFLGLGKCDKDKGSLFAEKIINMR